MIQMIIMYLFKIDQFVMLFLKRNVSSACALFLLCRLGRVSIHLYLYLMDFHYRSLNVGCPVQALFQLDRLPAFAEMTFSYPMSILNRYYLEI